MQNCVDGKGLELTVYPISIAKHSSRLASLHNRVSLIVYVRIISSEKVRREKKLRDESIGKRQEMGETGDKKRKARDEREIRDDKKRGEGRDGRRKKKSKRREIRDKRLERRETRKEKQEMRDKR
jgi:hypothetical protein